MHSLFVLKLVSKFGQMELFKEHITLQGELK